MIDEGSILFLLYIINKSTSFVACPCMSGFCLGLCYGHLCLIKKKNFVNRAHMTKQSEQNAPSGYLRSHLNNYGPRLNLFSRCSFH